MKKLLILLVVLVSALFVSAKPVEAVCRTVKVERVGYAYVRTVCYGDNVDSYVRAVATSTNGSAVAIATSIVRVFSFRR